MVKVRYENFETHTQSSILPFLTDKLSDFENAEHELMKPYVRPERKIGLCRSGSIKLVLSEKQKVSLTKLRGAPLSKAELMEKIANEIRVCVKCPLHKGRRNAVPGAGNTDSIVLFVGEAPGYWEDLEGLPFVGAAGKVLDALLTDISLPRDSVFITNVVKCRPPENRDPGPNEVKTCASLYLDRQITLIRPKIIVTLGRHSTYYVFSKGDSTKTLEGITQVRGRVYHMQFLNLSVLVIPMFHPAAVLHNPKYRDALEGDFELLKTQLRSMDIRE